MAGDEDVDGGEEPDGPASYLRDWVYGGIDGAVTTFAVVAGVAGAALSNNVILILGFANLVADGFSMAAGNYSSSRTESEQYDRLVGQVRRRIRDHADAERHVLEQIYERKGFSEGEARSLARTISANEDGWVQTVMIESFGMTPIVRSPIRAALNTYAAFLVCGFVPLLPYLIGLHFSVSAAMTGVVFFAIGSLKSRWTDVSWIRSGLNTLAIGGIAAVIAYLIGYGLELVVGDAPV